MRFLLAAVTALLFIALLETPWLKKHPSLLYVAAMAMDALYAYGIISGASGGLWYYFMPVMQRCVIAFVLFTVVMFVGVFDERSPIKARLLPIRRQMSILACIFCCCHVAFYGFSYLPRLTETLAANAFVAILVGLVVAALMIPLLVTSFMVVKTKMHAATWKKVQQLAYPFYLLTLVHLIVLLAPSAIAGNSTAILGVVVYVVTGVSYIVLRLRRHSLDARQTVSAA